MSFRIVKYTPDLSFLNAPSVSVIVDVAEPGEPARTLKLEATDAAARAICTMVENPAWNGEGTRGVDDQIATGEISLPALQAFVQAKIDAARTAPAEVTARIVAAEEAETRARAAAATVRRAEADRDAAVAEERAARDRIADLNAEIAAAEAKLAPK